jgi:hypothetical protein
MQTDHTFYNFFYKFRQIEIKYLIAIKCFFKKPFMDHVIYRLDINNIYLFLNTDYYIESHYNKFNFK